MFLSVVTKSVGAFVPRRQLRLVSQNTYDGILKINKIKILNKKSFPELPLTVLENDIINPVIKVKRINFL